MDNKVYFLPWDRKEELYSFLKAARVFSHVKARQYLAIKMHFGEEGNEGYIKPQYTKTLVKIAREKTAFPFLTDASTIYVGKRADAYHHLLVADKHGFNIENCGCPIIIADGLRGNAETEVEINLKHFEKVTIARDIYYSDSFIFLNHFKGHEVTGFGGALKNIGMGCGSKAGKYAMHNTSKPRAKTEKCTACGTCVKWCKQNALNLKDKKITMNKEKCVGCGQCIVNCAFHVFGINWNEDAAFVQEKIVEYAAAVLKGKKAGYINFLNHISKNCDCFGFMKNPPMMQDIGIIAGNDPVAVDQASYDMVNKVYGKNFCKDMHSGLNPEVQLAYAEKIGLGSRKYKLVKY